MSDDKPMCRWCDKGFDSVDEWMDHIREHSENKKGVHALITSNGEPISWDQAPEYFAALAETIERRLRDVPCPKGREHGHLTLVIDYNDRQFLTFYMDVCCKAFQDIIDLKLGLFAPRSNPQVMRREQTARPDGLQTPSGP